MAKVYSKKYSKKEVLKIIKNSTDEEFIVVFLPREKDKADMILRSVEDEEDKANSWVDRDIQTKEQGGNF